MDLYSTSFTIPRSVGASSFVSDPAASAPGPSNSAPGFGNDVLRNATNLGSRAGPAASPAQEAPASSLPGRFTSMRSRFPPSVKAFMPSAFGGKRTSERIVEAVGAEKAEADASAADAAAAANKSSSTTAAKDVETSAPLAPIGERGNARPSKLAHQGIASPDDVAASQHRDSRSTVGTRSSFDLSSNASFVADSTAPSSAVGGNPSSTTHSASNSHLRQPARPLHGTLPELQGSPGGHPEAQLRRHGKPSMPGLLCSRAPARRVAPAFHATHPPFPATELLLLAPEPRPTSLPQPQRCQLLGLPLPTVPPAAHRYARFPLLRLLHRPLNRRGPGRRLPRPQLELPLALVAQPAVGHRQPRCSGGRPLFRPIAPLAPVRRHGRFPCQSQRCLQAAPVQLPPQRRLPARHERTRRHPPREPLQAHCVHQGAPRRRL
ncbi:hypothetical protein L1887_57921 [Cichorium endivia]|nr:hypothetical protein L1887_57921 [Cichorium endivia]